jgi:hypothetical protein
VSIESHSCLRVSNTTCALNFYLEIGISKASKRTTNSNYKTGHSCPILCHFWIRLRCPLGMDNNGSVSVGQNAIPKQ